jgi:hypothetical protein
MPRGRPKKKMQFKSVPRTNQDIAIEERLAGCGRKESEHIIYVGALVERTLKGEFGAVLKALTAGRTSAELSSNRDGKMSADRILGRLEMADNLWADLEQFVLDKDAQLKPLEQFKEEKFSTSEPVNYLRAEEAFQFSP